MSKPLDPRAELRELPAVETLLSALDSTPGESGERAPRDLELAWARETLALARASILASTDAASLPARGREAWTVHLVEQLRARRSVDQGQKLQRVINATGVLLHTNLGRAPLSADAQAALRDATLGYSSLEMDLSSGRRRSRLAAVRELLPLVTGAEAGLAVHNNAAAVYLMLTALAAGREVIVSRGHLVEIGGGFRLPDIMAASGARLIEVGTTNRTRREDYARAVGPSTALLLKIHPSNFRIIGFHEETSTRELKEIAEARGIPLVEDLGSGALAQHGRLAFGEPCVQDSLKDGADLVLVSGDKLLGGPQAGLLVGRAKWIDPLASHPVARVVRLDKAALAALEATLRAYLDPATVAERIPLLTLLAQDEEALTRRAELLAATLATTLPSGWRATVIETRAEVGGGSLPGLELPSRAVWLAHDAWSPDKIAIALRRARPAIAGRIEEDRFLLDLRTLLEGEEAELGRAARAVLESSPQTRPPRPEDAV